MNEHPILFQGWKVRKILDWDWSLGNMQTRRVINPQPLKWAERFEPAPFDFGNGSYGRKGDWIQMSQDAEHMRGLGRCRYGAPGDRLWVRENLSVELKATKRDIENGLFCFQADDDEGNWTKKNGYRTIPSIHMQKWMARIWLEVLDIRVERVQAITPADVHAEGITQTQPDGYWLAPLAGVPDFPYGDATRAYMALWEHLNGKRAFGWAVNPWVWVVTYKAIPPFYTKEWPA